MLPALYVIITVWNIVIVCRKMLSASSYLYSKLFRASNFFSLLKSLRAAIVASPSIYTGSRNRHLSEVSAIRNSYVFVTISLAVNELLTNSNSLDDFFWNR